MRELGDGLAHRMAALVWCSPGDLRTLILHGLLDKFGRSGFEL